MEAIAEYAKTGDTSYITATCTENGNIAYYTCICGKWFADENCTTEIINGSSAIVEKLGHDFSGKYEFDGEGHWLKCSRCDATDEKKEHTFYDDADATCNQCEYVRSISPVTITAYKDGTIWTDNPSVYQLTSDDGETFVTDLSVVLRL